MAKSTFENLPEEKTQTIYNALVAEFETNLLSKASVSSIINRCGIARSFYQYFEDLQDSFFTVMENEIGWIHNLFMELMAEGGGDHNDSLRKYGEVLYNELYKAEKYKLYKNIYTYWDRV